MGRLPAALTADVKAIDGVEPPDRDYLVLHGLCSGVKHPEVFFPVNMTNIAGWDQAAIAICECCPIRIPCLAYATADRDILITRGVWGGRNQRQRRSIFEALRYRRRQRTATVAHLAKQPDALNGHHQPEPLSSVADAYGKEAHP